MSLKSALECYGGNLSNPVIDPNVRLSCFLYDENDGFKCALGPNDVLAHGSFTASQLRIFHSPVHTSWTFPGVFRLNPGDTMIFSLTLFKKQATIYRGQTFSETFDLIKGPPHDTLREHAAMTAHVDPYFDKLIRLAHVHALLGSSRQDFDADLVQKGIRDNLEIKKLSKEQFQEVNAANSTVHLQGDKTRTDDQTIYDQTAMLATAVNTRLAASALAQHPEQYDITKPEDRLAMTNASANALLNNYHRGVGPFEVTKSMSSSTVHKTCKSVTVQLDAIRDIFESLALPEAALVELLGAVQSFVDSTKQLAFDSSNKDLHNAKLVNFYSVQPPLGNPDLQHLAKMRMIHVQFDETTNSWTSRCASGQFYDLKVMVFVLDVELNRAVVSLMYDKCKEVILQAAETTLDEIGSSGAPEATNKPVSVPGSNTIGPPPIPPPF